MNTNLYPSSWLGLRENSEPNLRIYPRSAISRPGDGDRSPVFDLNFNRAELKIAECLQLLDKATTHHLFSKPVTLLFLSCQHCHFSFHNILCICVSNMSGCFGCVC